jgi:hypothetical protein
MFSNEIKQCLKLLDYMKPGFKKYMKEEEALFGKKKGTSGKAGAGQKRVIEG